MNNENNDKAPPTSHQQHHHHANGNGSTAAGDTDVAWRPDDNDNANANCSGEPPSGNVILYERKGNQFHLAAIVRKYTSAKITFVRDPKSAKGYQQQVVRVDKKQLGDALGLLRSLQYDVQQYNSVMYDCCQAVADDARPKLDPLEARYRCFRLSRQAVAMGVRLPSLEGIRNMYNAINDYSDSHNNNDGNSTTFTLETLLVTVDGLDSLIEFIELTHSNEIAVARATIEQGLVDFESLQEYYQPGQVFVDHGVGTGVRVETLMRARACYYSRRKNLFGEGVTFHVAMEVVVSTGNGQYAIVEAQYLQSTFHGSRSIETSLDFFTRPTLAQLARLKGRGEIYQSICDGQQNGNTNTGSGVMISYDAGTFLPTSRGSLGASGSSSRAGSYGQASRSEGRMIVDTVAAWSRGVNCALHSGVASDAVIGTLKTYAEQRSQQQHQSQQGGDISTVDASSDADRNSEYLILSSPLPESLVGMTWPVVPGFSLNARTWGVAMVHGTHPVKFQEHAFESLVMSTQRKKLIKALVMSHEAKRSADVIAGKGEGSIFLLHGPPGVGKTLTAEAISEMLHKPLYVVSMGELGTTPEALESRLQDILDLCVPWKALVLIDEAEMLLERRTKNDILRNSMVCVMLRLLEYYSGILFLTTNRVESLDPAFQSRVTCALRYDKLSLELRQEIWDNLILRLGIDATALDIPELARADINGRQIKNTLQLALALAQHDNVPLTQEHLQTTLDVTTSFLKDTSDWTSDTDHPNGNNQDVVNNEEPTRGKWNFF